MTKKSWFSVTAVLALAVVVLDSRCATRVGNPPKPAAINVPLISELVPPTTTPTGAPGNGFPGDAAFVGALAASAPRQRAVLSGMNEIGKRLGALELEIDVAKTTTVDGVDVKVIVRSDAEKEDVRHAVACAAGKAFYAATWTEGESGVSGTVDMRSDPLHVFATVAEADRQFVAGLAFSPTAERQEVDLTIDGAPTANDPFVGTASRLLERGRFRSRAADTKIVYQGTQLWYETTATDGAVPQVTLAGLLGTDGAYQYAIHHVEAKLLCPSPLDRAQPDAPGWCAGYTQAAGAASGEFTDAATAQTLWDGIKADGLIDPATTHVPTVAGECPE